MTSESINPQEKPPLDVSEKFTEIWSGTEGRIRQLTRSLLRISAENTPIVNLTIDYPGLNLAAALKGLKDRFEIYHAAPWNIAIRANVRQMKEAANVFASGIEWINNEAEAQLDSE